MNNMIVEVLNSQVEGFDDTNDWMGRDHCL